MDVSSLLSSIIRDLSQPAATTGKQTGFGENVKPEEALKTFSQELAAQQKDAKKEADVSQTRNTQLKQAADRFVKGQGQKQGTKHSFYNAKGQLLKLGRFQQDASTQQLQSLLQQAAQDGDEAAQGAQFAAKVADAADDMVSLLIQQALQHIKDSLEGYHAFKKPKKKRFKKNDGDDGEAEEQAFELLEIILENAAEADDMDDFCAWARSAVQSAEADMLDHVGGKMPEKLAKVFQIMKDAIIALEHGVSPDYIFQRLEQEMDRKKNL